jgi:uncharacterized protein DUF5906
MSESIYRTVPPLAAYIDRIGAEELNFRRFMVKEYKGDYYVERTLIVIKPDGTIDCNNKEHAPTKEEAEHIKIALQVTKFPRSVGAGARQVKELIASGKLHAGAIIYEFLNSAGEVAMVQERAMVKDQKQFFPWTYWDDSQWRRMEPEGALPFWRPSTKLAKAAIMIHEGAKAAKFITELCNDAERLKAHPWGEELAMYEHWGLIGGALAPHRADYGALIREKPTEVVYVCDNDFPGQSALQEVSKHYGYALRGVLFDPRFPPGWDMAEDMPKNLYAASGRYTGPTLAELTQAATRATELVYTGEKGRPTARVTIAFKEEWTHSVTPEVFIHRDWPYRTYTLAEFNSLVRPFSDVDDTARLLKMVNASKSAVLKYSPADKPGIYGDEGGRYINTHWPSPIKPEEGDPAPFLEFMEHLVPEEAERTELLRWIATLVARRNIKMLYGVLLISEVQGVGKGTLGEKILAPLVGEANVSYPSEHDIVESAFNYWLAHKRLAIVHEIYAGSSSKAYNRLKSIITDRYITVSKKFQANYEIENCMHVFACSNSMRAIRLTMDDRRWFVPKVTDEKKSAQYWSDFNMWLTERGGLRIIRWWADKWLETNQPVLPGAPAPWSELKKEIVEEGYSQGQLLVARVLERIAAAIKGEDEEFRRKLEERGMLKGENAYFFDKDLVDLIKQEIHGGRPSDRLEKPSTVRKVAKSMGWFPGKLQVKSGPRIGARTVCSNAALALKSPAELCGVKISQDEKLEPIDVQWIIGF